MPELETSDDPMLALARMDFSSLKEATPIYAGRPEAFSSVTFKPYVLKMAAADSDNLQTRMIVLDEAGIEIQPGLMSILTSDRTDDQLFIHGKIDPDFSPPSEIFAWWETPENTYPAAIVELTEDKHLFTVTFSEISRKMHLRGKMVIIFLGYRDT